MTRFLSEDELARYQDWFDNARRLKELLAKVEIVSAHALESDRRRLHTTHTSKPRSTRRSTT